jgi:hypothetical protein
MAEKDVRRFAKVVGSRLDSPRMKKFLATYDAAPVIDESDGIHGQSVAGKRRAEAGYGGRLAHLLPARRST